MRHHYSKIDAETYKCEHPLYNVCTLYRREGKGLAVVQLRFNQNQKLAWWSSIDKYLIYDIPNRPGFDEYFEAHADEISPNGLYPTVALRNLMWALKMKPLRKTDWEAADF